MLKIFQGLYKENVGQSLVGTRRWAVKAGWIIIFGSIMGRVLLAQGSFDCLRGVVSVLTLCFACRVSLPELRDKTERRTQKFGGQNGGKVHFQ